MFRKITSHRDRSELEEGDDDMFSYDDVPNDDTLSSSPKTPTTTPTRVSSFKQTVKTKRRVSTVFHKPTINQTSLNNNNLNERASFSFFTSDDDQAFEQNNTPRPLSQSGSSSSTSSPNKNSLTNNNKIDINNEHTFQYYQQHHQSSYEIERNNYQSLLTTNRSNKLIDFVSLFSISNEELNTIAKEQFNEATCLTLLNNNENKNYFTMTTSLQREGSLISFFPDKHLKNDENDTTTTIIEEERKKKKNSELDFEISTMNLQYFTFPNDVHLKFVVTAPTDLYNSNRLNKNDNNDVKINKNHIEKDSAKDNFGNNEMNNNNPLPEELIISNNEGNINEENNNNEEENKSEMKNNVDKEMMNEKQEEKNELNNLNNNNNFFIPEIESFESYPIQYKDFPMLSKIFGEDDNSSSTTTTATTTSVSNQNNNNGSSNNNDINSYRNSISSNNSNNTENDIENDDSDGLYYDNNYNNNIKREKHYEDIDHFYPSKNFHSFIGTDGYGYRYYGFCYLKYFTFQLIPKFKDQDSNIDINISDNNNVEDNRFRKVLMFVKVPSCICILSRFQFHRTFLTFYSNLDQYLINNEIYLFDNSLLEYIYYLFNKNENIKLFDKLIIHFPLNKLQSNNNNNEENNKNIIQLETTVEFDKNLFIGDSDDQFKEEEKSLHDKTSTVNGSNNSENGNSGDVNKKEEQQQVKEEVSPLIEMTKKQFLFFQHLNHNNNNNNDNTKELNILKYPTCDFDFNILVNNLHIDHIIKIINYITLEKPIIFHSKYLFKLVIIMESLRYLLYPFRLTSVYIPILHEKISHFLEAPFPYMVGLHSEVLTKFWNEELDITIPGGVCIVNVDEDSIEYQNDQLEKNDINHRWTSDIISFIKDNLEKKLGTTNNNNSTNTPPPSLSSSFRNSESYSSVSFSESSSNLSSSSLSSNSNISNNISNYSLNEQQSSNSTNNINNNRSSSIVNNNHSIITRRRSRVVVSSPKSLSTASTTNINNSLMKQLFNNNTLDEETLSPLSAPSSFPTANSNNNSFIKKQQIDIHPIREVFLNLFLKFLQTLELFINYENYDEKKDMKLSDLFQIDKFILISELFNFTPINNLLFTNNFNYLNNFFKTQLFHFFIQKKCEIYIKKNINIYYKLFDKKLSQQTERFSLNISLLNNSYRKGYLFKRGRIRKSWKSRFFVLRDFNLIYYSNNDENQVKGQIKLNSKNTKIFPIKVNASNKQLTKNQYDLFLSELKKLDFNKEDEIPPLNEEFPTPHVFVILSMTTGRLLFCCAESEKIRDEWIKVLRVKTMDRKVFNMLQEYLSKKDIESRLKLKLSASLGDFNNITTSNTLNSNTTTTIGKGNKEEEEEKNIQIDKVFKYQPNLNIPFVKRNEYNEYLFESYYRDINNNNNNGGNNGLLFNEYNIDTYHLFELSLEDIVMNSCYNTKRKK
ncbi:hypothetical protein ABK040_015375 [Willaertia magna]